MIQFFCDKSNLNHERKKKKLKVKNSSGVLLEFLFSTLFYEGRNENPEFSWMNF